MLRKVGVCHIFVENVIVQTGKESNRFTFYDKVFSYNFFFSNLESEGVLIVCEIFIETEIVSKTAGK